MANRGTISDRDWALLRLLDHTPATAELIRLASVSFPGGPFRDPRRVRERLNALAQMRLVSSFSATQGIGGPINWYKLTQDGFRLLYGPDVPLPHRSRFAATSPSRFHHMQTLAEVIVHLLAAAHRARVTVTRFFGDGELTIEGAGRKLQPDCFFQLQQAGRQFNFMVEVDHATEPLDSHSAHAVRQKIEVYESHQDTTWQWWKQQPPGTPRSYFRVLFLTTTAERASHFLWLARECARNRDRRLCYAAPQSVFLAEAEPLRSPIFNDHHGGWQSLINLHPTSQFTRTPIRLSPPVTLPGQP